MQRPRLILISAIGTAAVVASMIAIVIVLWPNRAIPAAKGIRDLAQKLNGKFDAIEYGKCDLLIEAFNAEYGWQNTKHAGRLNDIIDEANGNIKQMLSKRKDYCKAVSSGLYQRATDLVMKFEISKYKAFFQSEDEWQESCEGFESECPFYALTYECLRELDDPLRSVLKKRILGDRASSDVLSMLTDPVPSWIEDAKIYQPNITNPIMAINVKNINETLKDYMEFDEESLSLVDRYCTNYKTAYDHVRNLLSIHLGNILEALFQTGVMMQASTADIISMKAWKNTLGNAETYFLALDEKFCILRIHKRKLSQLYRIRSNMITE